MRLVLRACAEAANLGGEVFFRLGSFGDWPEARNLSRGGQFGRRKASHTRLSGCPTRPDRRLHDRLCRDLADQYRGNTRESSV